jgi:hypothetical protein
VGQYAHDQGDRQSSIALGGHVAGPDQSTENRIGEGGMRLHQWALATDTWNDQRGQTGGERSAGSLVVEEAVQGLGAYIMGRPRSRASATRSSSRSRSSSRRRRRT